MISHGMMYWPIKPKLLHVSTTDLFRILLTQTLTAIKATPQRESLTNYSDLDGEKFFVDLAKSKKFDPLDAEKWYTISHKEILQAVSSFL
jgi:hypothetical protein